MRGIATTASRLCLTGFAVLWLSATAVAQPGAPIDPTHYWSYTDFDSLIQPQPIFVNDQFFPQGVSVTVDRLSRRSGPGTSVPESRRIGPGHRRREGRSRPTK